MGKCVFDPRSDFSFLLTVKDNEGNEVPLSELDFEGQVYTTSLTGYRFSARFLSEERKQFHCQLRGDQVLIICDNHGLCSGNVKVLLKIHYPDELYPDGIRTEVKRFDTGITLSANANAETPEATPDVSVTVPTVVAKAKKKSFHLSEYCANGMIPSNAQPGVIYHCEFMKFDKLGAKMSNGNFIEAKRKGKVNVSRLFAKVPFNVELLPYICKTDRTLWAASMTTDNNGDEILEYLPVAHKHDDSGIQPIMYQIGLAYWYIDANGTLREFDSHVGRKLLPFYLPGIFSEWEGLKGRFELQRRERIKTLKNIADKGFTVRKYNKWVYLKEGKGYPRNFNAAGVVAKLNKMNVGVFRIRRVSVDSKRRRRNHSQWVYFTLWHNKSGGKEIKKL